MGHVPAGVTNLKGSGTPPERGLLICCLPFGPGDVFTPMEPPGADAVIADLRTNVLVDAPVGAAKLILRRP
jgi:hypothetical protein